MALPHLDCPSRGRAGFQPVVVAHGAAVSLPAWVPAHVGAHFRGAQEVDPSASLGHLRTGFRSVWPRVRARPCSWRNSALSGFLIFKADAFSSGPGQRVARAPPEWLPSSPKQEGPSLPSCGTWVVAAAWRGARLCYHRRGGPQREGRVSLGAAFRSSSGERRQCSQRH